jgi:alkylhydroperoxidase family enzyme
MGDSLTERHDALHRAVLDGPGTVDPSIRQQIAHGTPPPDLAGLVQKIRRHAYRVTDADVDALRAHYSDDQLFEIIIAAAVGAAEHRYRRALAAVEGA